MINLIIFLLFPMILVTWEEIYRGDWFRGNSCPWHDHQNLRGQSVSKEMKQLVHFGDLEPKDSNTTGIFSSYCKTLLGTNKDFRNCFCINNLNLSSISKGFGYFLKENTYLNTTGKFWLWGMTTEASTSNLRGFNKWHRIMFGGGACLKKGKPSVASVHFFCLWDRPKMKN